MPGARQGGRRGIAAVAEGAKLMRSHFGVAPPILVFSGIGMFTWGYGILTHGHVNRFVRRGHLLRHRFRLGPAMAELLAGWAEAAFPTRHACAVRCPWSQGSKS